MTDGSAPSSALSDNGRLGDRSTSQHARASRRRLSDASSADRSRRSHLPNFDEWPSPSEPDSKQRSGGPALISVDCWTRATPRCTKLSRICSQVSTDGSSSPKFRFRSMANAGSSMSSPWHPGRRALLVIELKTEIVDVSDLLGSMDRRRRLSRQIARSRRWDPIEVSTWVVVAESRTNRRAVSSHARVLRSKLPLDGRGIARWLRDPVGRVDALSFLPNRHPVALGRPTAPVRRASPRSQRPSRA